MTNVIIFKINKEDYKTSSWFTITPKDKSIYRLVTFDTISSIDDVMSLLKKHNVKYHTISSVGNFYFNEAFGRCEKTGDYIIILPENSKKYQEISRCLTIQAIIS